MWSWLGLLEASPFMTYRTPVDWIWFQRFCTRLVVHLVQSLFSNMGLKGCRNALSGLYMQFMRPNQDLALLRSLEGLSRSWWS